MSKSNKKPMSLLEGLELVTSKATVEEGLLSITAEESFENVTGLDLESLDKAGEALTLFASVTGLATGKMGSDLITEENPEVALTADISVGKFFNVGHRYLSNETINDVETENVLRTSVAIELDLDGFMTDIRNRVTATRYK